MDNQDAIRESLGMTDDDILILECPFSPNGEEVRQWLEQKYDGGLLIIPVGWKFKSAPAEFMQR